MQRIHGFPDVSVNADRSTTVPGFVVSSPPPPIAFFLPADVAVSSTAVPTIEQRARRPGFLEPGVSHWNGPQRRFAEKEGDVFRQRSW